MTNSSSSNSTTGGIGFTGALFLVFLVLKLTHVVSWSWWWITAPLWISSLLGLLGGAFLLWLWLSSPEQVRKRDRKRVEKKAKKEREDRNRRYGGKL